MLIRRWLVPSLCIALAGAAAAQSTAPAQPAGASASAVPLIPRSVIFGNPDRAAPRLSPDGKQISFLAPVNGVLNVWVAPRADASAAKPITNDTKRGIRQHFWSYDNKHVLYVQDKDGDENFHLYAADVNTATSKDLTPYPGVKAQVAGLSW